MTSAEVVCHFLLDLARVLRSPGLALLGRGLAQLQLLVEHVLLVVQVQLGVGVGDQVELPRQQEVVEVEVIWAQVQVLLAWGEMID